MAKKKNYKPLMALVALAAAALVAATMTFTNVTYWLINATKPPAMKYAGADTEINDRYAPWGRYVIVGYYYDSGNGLNITRISIIGFTGDPVNYTSVIKVCNYYGGRPIKATLVWVGKVENTGNESYIKKFYVWGPNGQRVGFDGSTTYNTAGPYTIDTGECIDIGAYVAIDPAIPPNLADGKTMLGEYQVNIVMSPSS
jgi:hypothetical protein